MNYTFNCKRCVKRGSIPDKNGIIHEICLAYTLAKRYPIHYSLLRQEVSCEEYKEETVGSST